MRKTLIGMIFGLGLAVSSAAGQQDYCFLKRSLRPGYMVSFTVTGGSVEGSFFVGDPSGRASDAKFDLSGMKKGNLVTVKFNDGKAPYELPPGTRTIVWTIRSARALSVPMYRKNTRTRKYSVVTAAFGSCRDI